jgi:serine/threonine-protein kinase
VLFLAVMLGVLVLLCSGVISYNVRLKNSADLPVGVSVQTVSSVVRGFDGRDDPAGTAYRRLDQPRGGSHETTTSEGRRTR